MEGVAPYSRSFAMRSVREVLSLRTSKTTTGSRMTVVLGRTGVQETKAHDSPAYQAALAALGDGAERDIRLVEGV